MTRARQSNGARFKIREIMFFLATFATVVLFAGEAAAVKVHTQRISLETAQGMCGGYDACNFCHGDHCHIVSCGDKGCENTVYPRGAIRGGATNPVSGTGARNPPSKTSGTNTPPGGGSGPVTVGGVRAPTGGTSASPSGGGTTTIYSKGSSGGSKH